MSSSPIESSIDPNREWHCLRTQTKREHIAAALLDRIEAVEVYCPRISQVKKTRAGKKRFTEALFPGYIFAQFCFATHSRQVVHSQGITKMVQLGERRVIPARIIEDLKASLPEGIIDSPDQSLEPGAEIDFITGSLKGLNGKVLAQLSAKNRIQVLLEFLGREITVDVTPDSVLLTKKAQSR
jgi:transcriptional antiterminator RfaH